MTVYGVWMGALDVEVAREARDAVTSAVENLTDFFAAVPTERHQHLRHEAEAALARIAAEGRR